MTEVTARFLGLDGMERLYWDLDALDASLPPRAQVGELKEDLAQFRLSASDLLDLGWYPSFDPDGHFVVLVVTDGDWEQPAFRGEAATWSELRALIRDGLATAGQGCSWSRPRTERRMMSYSVTHLSGEMETGFPLERFGELLDQLESADGEHTDVSVAHESDWSLSLFRSGYLIFENLEEGGARHMGPVDRDVALELMKRLASGQVREILELEGWRAGYPLRG